MEPQTNHPDAPALKKIAIETEKRTEGRGRGMRLRGIELYGFKSFADRTKLTFDDGITAVVGPNGSRPGQGRCP